MSHQTQYLLIVIFILIGMLSRLLPHIPNITALTSMSIILGMQFSRRMTLAIILATLLGSDLALAYYFGYPTFGSWTFFTYTGFITIGLFAAYLPTNKKSPWLLIYLLSSSLGFWLWTNFGVWLFSGMYPKNLFGLFSCYTAALPFLRNSLLGDLAWMVVLLGVLRLMQHQKQKPIFNPY